ncbi:UNVERIFIED_CONTAM: CSC1-like protein [Sesamum calycinum]|uniref:CSC1-like protein n=1 Tax=Sesamum calycinum TaxID=2727403 RepID=A0AAW2M247_9LAMI
MASLADIGVSALINILGAFAFLLAFALLRIQPINDRVYFPKWYIAGKRTSPRNWGGVVGKFVNLNLKTYLTFLNWMPQALKMSESEIISHAGLDSAVFLRIYLLGLKIFGPIAIAALLLLIPVNVSDGTLFFLRRDLVVSEIDKLSISNVRPKSYKFFVHISMEYLFTFWVCYMLYKEYDRVASMRLNFLASQGRRAEQFTVLVRNVPHVSGRSISDSVETFFQKNHPDRYLCHQAVYDANKFAKLVRKRNRLQNWLDYNQLKFERHPDKRPTGKRGFLGLWGERVDSIDYYKEQITDFDKKTQQSKNPTLWLTSWAPEPRDVYWKNLAIPFVSLSIRKLVISLSVFALVFFYMIPIAFVQSLANLEGLEKVAPFLRPLIEWSFVKSFLQGFLPGLALKIFLYFLPAILMIMSKIEGHVANPRNIGVSIPMEATFFINTLWLTAGLGLLKIPAETLVIFHLKNMFIVKTERDLEKAMDPGGVDFPETLPSLQLYFLLGIVYMVINVYNQQYESAAAFWPHVHGSYYCSKLTDITTPLNGLIEHKKSCKFHSFARRATEAMSKDTQDRASESDVDLKSYLADAYLHPIFHSFEEVELVEVKVDKNQSHVHSSSPSELSSPSPQHTYHHEDEPSHIVQHYEVEPNHTMHHYAAESPSNIYRYEYAAEQHYQYYHY